jgi:hypothetical protein
MKMDKFAARKEAWKISVKRLIAEEIKAEYGSIQYERLDCAVDELFSKYHVLKKTDKVSNPFLRITLILFPIVWLFLLIGIVPNYIITGYWGYKNLEWFRNWTSKLGI